MLLVQQVKQGAKYASRLQLGHDEILQLFKLNPI